MGSVTHSLLYNRHYKLFPRSVRECGVNCSPPYSTGHLACTEEIGNVFRISVRGTEIIDNLEDAGVDGRIILNLLLKK
jgi:hypothetical protein